MNQVKHCLFLVGATGVGKTSLAYEVALKYHLPILSVDARQCFQELNIGVARPSTAMLSSVPHYFIATHSVTKVMDVKCFERYALNCLEMLFQHNNLVLVVGGSGLYLRALEQGIMDVPPISEDIQKEVRDLYHQEGLLGVVNALKQEDPLFFERGEIKNPHRVIRALSVIRATSKSIYTFQQQSKVQRPFSVHKIGLQLPMEQLYHQINDRTHQMIANGWLEEVRSLRPYWGFFALNTIGYKELRTYLEGEISWEDAITTIQKHTRHYAKRQGTWFRKDKDILWLTANASDTLMHLENLVKQYF